jgi:hypothetical protein
MWGCHSGAVYNSADDVARLAQRPNFRLQDGVLVEAIVETRQGLELRATDRTNNCAINLIAPHVVVAAGAIASTRLVLGCLQHYDMPVPLMHSPACAAALLAPSFIGRALPERGFGMAQLAFQARLGDASWDYGFGLLYDAAAMAAPDLIAHMPLTRRGAMSVLQGLLPGLMVGLAYLPGEYSANRATLRRGSTPDQDRLTIEGGVSAEAAPRMKQLMRRVGTELRKCGLHVLPGSVKPYGPGAEVHYGGSLARLTDGEGAVAGRRGLHVVDGAVLPRIAAKSHTFTLMANADRIATRLAEQLRGQQLAGGPATLNGGIEPHRTSG